MKLFVELDSEGNISNTEEYNSAVESRFYSLTHKEMAVKDWPEIKDRLRAWTEIVQEAGFPDFDAEKLYWANVNLGEHFYTQNSIFGNSSLIEHKSQRYSIYSFDSDRQNLEENAQFGFVIARRDLRSANSKDVEQAKWVGRSKVDGQWQVTYEEHALTTIPDKHWAALAEEGIIDKVSESMTSLQSTFSHDFMHMCTAFSTSFDSDNETPKVIAELQKDGANSRGANQGYENFLLLMNQRLFCKLREKESPWFESLLEKVQDFGEVLEEIKDPASKKVIKDLAIAHVSNYIPRDILKSTPVSEWEGVLRTAQPQVSDDRLEFKGKTCSLEDISMRFYKATAIDYKNRENESQQVSACIS